MLAIRSYMLTLMRCIYLFRNFQKFEVVQEVTIIQDHDLLYKILLQQGIHLIMVQYILSTNVSVMSWPPQPKPKLLTTSSTVEKSFLSGKHLRDYLISNLLLQFKKDNYTAS